MEAQPTRFFFLELPGALREAAARAGAHSSVPMPRTSRSSPNATTGCNAVLRSLRFGRGTRVLHVSHVYNAVRNTIALRRRAGRREGVVAEIPFPRPERAAIAEEHRAGDRPSAPASPSSTTSPRQRPGAADRSDIVRLCHAADVPVLVDGAHGPGQVPLDLPALDADWYVGTCHKWLCAPKGCGFLYARADRRAGPASGDDLARLRQRLHRRVRLDGHDGSVGLPVAAGRDRLLRAAGRRRR